MPRSAAVPLVLMAFVPPVAAGWEPGSAGLPEVRTPRRPLSADRPDATESPFTVEPGFAQAEVSLLEYARSGGEDAGEQVLAIVPTNLKLGLTPRVDLQTIWTPYQRQRRPGPDRSGPGDLQFRVKINLWGNDGGATAMAALPYVTLPTASDGLGVEAVEAGVVLPVAIDLAPAGLEGFTLGAQAEFAAVEAEDGGGHDGLFAHTVVLGVPLGERVGAYVEYVGQTLLREGSAYEPTFSAGLTVPVGADTLFDAGLRVGLDDDTAEDLVVFVGFTRRF